MKSKTFVVLAFALTAASCRTDETVMPDRLLPDDGHICFSVSTESLTRVTTDDDFKTTFDEGDEVGLFIVSRSIGTEAPLLSSGNYVDNRKLRLSNGQWTMEGDPVYYPNDKLLDFYAYYPYLKDADPTAIVYDAAQSVYDLMSARVIGAEASSEPVQLLFRHKLALVEVVVRDRGNSVTMQNIIPTAALDLSAPEQEEEMTLGDSETRINLALPAYDYKRAIFRTYLPAQPVAGGDLLHIEAGTQTPKYITEAYQLTAGRAKRYTVSTKILDIERMPNCYMVQPGEAVDIPVKKAYEVWRQESYLAVANPDLTGELTAELLWMDADGLVPVGGVTLQKDDVDIEQSTIRVTTSVGKSGNATIVAKIGGTIRWTWHIWVTDYDPDNGGKSYNYDNNQDGTADYVFMDRNLGASGTTPADASTAGNYYQGARFNPFPGPADVTTGTPGYKRLYGHGTTPAVDISKSVVDPASSSVEDVWASQAASIQFAVTHPLHFIKSKSSEPYSWTLTLTSSQYEDIAGTFWPYASGHPGKTLHDPCPEGWMLPVWKNNLSPWSCVPGNSGWNGSDIGYGWSDYGYYMLSGRIKFNLGTFTEVRSLGAMYAGERIGQKTGALTLQPNNKVNVGNNYSRGSALPVRCVRE